MGIAAYNRGSASIARGIKSSGHVCVNHPPPEKLPVIAAPFAVGETVYCKVIGQRGKPDVIVAVEEDRRGFPGLVEKCA